MHLLRTLILTILSAVALHQVFQFLHTFSATQCFSRVVPSTPLHGLSSVPMRPLVEFNFSMFQEQYQLPGIPLLVRHFADEWPAMKRWQDVAYFGNLCDTNFTSKVHGMTLKEYTDSLSRLEKQINPIQFSNMIELGEMYFKHNEELFYVCPALWDDVTNFKTARQHSSTPTTLAAKMARFLLTLFEVEWMPRDFVWGDWIQAVMWIGPPGSKTLLHYDDDPLSLLVQFKGSKRVRMWSSDQSTLMYPQSECLSLDEYGTRFSQFKGDPTKMTKIEKMTFPLLPTALYLDVELYPGDMLYIPSGWWHFVSVLDGSIESSVSVASRSYSTCEGMSYFPSFVANWIHSIGLLDMRGFCIQPSYLSN